jgi:hypothetical protein
VFAVFNFSEIERAVKFQGNLFPGRYRDAITGSEINLKASDEIQLDPGSYKIYVQS